MQKILETEIAKLLKAAEFEGTTKQAMNLLISVMEDRISSILKHASSRALHSSKANISLTDMLPVLTKTYSCGQEDSFPLIFGCTKCSDLSNKQDFNYQSLLHIFDVIEISGIDYAQEIKPAEEEWCSSISTRVEKAIHIYDFMPNFPPIHTFRLTNIKQSASKNMSSKVKNRLEQSLRSEGNLIKLIKSSGELPNFINFMYNRNDNK